MAKIEWVFQDESGANLNRYIATNVATGERITFDLLRGAIIQQGQEGTPLNASTLNSLITAINSNFDEITTLKQSVATNTSNIATNTSNIEANAKSILVLDTRTTTMGEVVEANTASIKSNTSAITKFTTNLTNTNKLVSANVKAISNIEDGTTTVKKAEQDSDGNNIVSTYATNESVTKLQTSLINTKYYQHFITLFMSGSPSYVYAYFTIINKSSTALTRDTIINYMPSNRMINATGYIQKIGTETLSTYHTIYGVYKSSKGITIYYAKSNSADTGSISTWDYINNLNLNDGVLEIK